jgi:aldehyde reductase
MLFKLCLLCSVIILNESLSPTITLNNGKEMPIIGLGTYNSTGNSVYQSVKDAIHIGYRHIDTAYLYQNEKEIGKALKEVFAEGKVKRQEVFVISKLWHTFHSRSRVIEGIKKSLENLGLEYLDLFLIHFPFGLKEGTNEMTPKDSEGHVLFSDVDYIDTWKGMEDAVNQGLTKSIGFSNFNSKQIDRVLEVAKIKPTVNQVECHPYLNQKKLFDFCKERKIELTAYSSLGNGELLKEPKIVEIAKELNATAAQVLIRYEAQRGIVVNPKTTNKARILENFSIFNLTLSEQDMHSIDSLNKNLRYNVVDYAKNHKYYPFNIPF